MSPEDALRALNEEIALQEDAVDQVGSTTLQFFERLLAPTFAMRRAGGDERHTDRAGYLSAIKPGTRRTEDIEVEFESPQCAVVTCVVRVRQDSATDGGENERWQAFRNVRLFTRSSSDNPWQLLAWANEPVQDN